MITQVPTGLQRAVPWSTSQPAGAASAGTPAAAPEDRWVTGGQSYDSLPAAAAGANGPIARQRMLTAEQRHDLHTHRGWNYLQKCLLTGGVGLAATLIPGAGTVLVVAAAALSTLNGQAAFDEMKTAQSCTNSGWETMGQGRLEQQRELPNTVKTVYAEPNQDSFLNLVPGRPFFGKQTTVVSKTI